ncbi:pentapeptide repeat-containing protein [Glycomyces sp. A-F 0318]|uniref:pentapeptide repeat-containing protein n=1 Tax=Glycomyces amatae TaxID=2881355 RepID=UPI001E483513|nr:pentapeptide repeat-containing protein [Glycomyces amatae]MCD0446444.1 pentapeptide repeat-containing protein [Glycomyces amatae]
MSETRERSGRGRWIWVVVVAGVVIIGAGAGAWWLVDPLSAATTADRAGAVQATFTLAFGFGGVATLALFARRQWHQERVHEHERQVAADGRYDAEQKRITDQYIQAIEQLGHDSSSVRLGGLYALDRLGRNHPDQRQVVAEVWCAYLRRRFDPYQVLVEPIGDRTSADVVTAAFEEFQVRATTQRLLARHLRPRPNPSTGADEHWQLERIDLTGAALVNPDFRDCVLPLMEARGLQCFRRARFDRARFTAPSFLQEARFHEPASFEDAQFAEIVSFHGAVFAEDVSFRGVEFKGVARFDEVQFDGVTGLQEAMFHQQARFSFLTIGDPAAVDLSGAAAADASFDDPQTVWPPGWEKGTTTGIGCRALCRNDNSPSGNESWPRPTT